MMIFLGNYFFKYRDFLFPVVCVSLAFSTKPELLADSTYADRWMDMAGISIALAGQILRALVIGFAYIRRGGRNKQIYADNLVQEGFFAHCRNPLYLGNIIIVIGLAVILNAKLFYIIGIPFFLLGYISIIKAEEDYLGKRFGKEYNDYCSRVNRFIPNFKGIGKSIEGMKFDWKKLISKEYGTTFAWISTAITLMIWEIYSISGYEANKAEIIRLAKFFIPVVFAYSIARFLKKTGRLQS